MESLKHNGPWDDIIKSTKGRISDKETVRLIIAAQQGDSEAEATIVRGNISLVVWQAKKLVPRARDSLDDLVADGLLGMVEAIRRFDPSRNIKFSTYATIHIRKQMLGGMPDRRRGLSVKRTIYYPAIRVANILADHGEDITNERIAELTGYTLTVTKRARVAANMLRLNKDGLKLLNDHQYSHDYTTPIVEREEYNQVRSYLATLPERERKIIMLKYGLDGKEPMPLRDLAVLMRTTKQTINALVRRTAANFQEQLGE